MAPLDLFNSLSGKASWLLEKLGIIKNESGDLDAAAAKAEAASSPAGSAYIPGAGDLWRQTGVSADHRYWRTLLRRSE
ncbi:phage Tail Tape Measure protein [Enterobacter asburiae]|uniref:Phage Tail Tape Measure protein n=1 Tax=Enterobacter asburiae TaxID=61645 RepID=A0A376FFD7_ENTAS|nr:phage Tail Tape Measure protein [Enterobacter asburiae]